jgi:hypothetical protein
MLGLGAEQTSEQIAAWANEGKDAHGNPNAVCKFWEAPQNGVCVFSLPAILFAPATLLGVDASARLIVNVAVWGGRAYLLFMRKG